MTMSSSEADEVCASCGTTGGDGISLKICTACRLVKYCSVECQKNHRPKHKKACKKRAAEIRDERLFTQPDGSHLGECSICCLPLPLDTSKSVINSCCCKRLCKGCNHANHERESEQGLYPKCAFCREPLPKSEEECEKNFMERAKANDPVAVAEMGYKCSKKGDYQGALEYYTKAAALGQMVAHFNLAGMYYKGQGVEKDEEKELYHLEEAAIGGNPSARYNLGGYEEDNRRIERAMKHYIIAAKLGYDKALEAVQDLVAKGLGKKEDYEAALRGHQAAVDATKSEQRENAEKNVAREGLVYFD
jgi:tetratricopeptide (TPR) repeat protein